jgi:O-acetyl-ADP-ribose deacetylase
MSGDCHAHAQQLHGYLQAVSALKDDGSVFLCAYLEPVAPQSAFDALCRALKIQPDGMRLQPIESTVCSGALCTPRQWLLERLNPMSEADRQPLDARLFDGFEGELAELLGSVPRWYQLVSSGQRSLAGQLGAIWSVFVFGTECDAYMMHCSWDR